METNNADLRKFKDLSLEEYQYIFEDFYCRTPPMWHQYVTLAFALKRAGSRNACFHDIGTGKTYSALLLARAFNAGRTLVVSPKCAFNGWERDIKQHTLLGYRILQGECRQRLSDMNEEAEIYVTNYEALKYMYGVHLPATDIAKGEWMIDQSKFIHNFDTVIFDEVHRVADGTSLQHNICYELSRRAGTVVALTGTPIGSQMLDLWAIYRVIDLGKCLGTNFWQYRTKYFYKAGFKWLVKKQCKQTILDLISPITTTFDRKECLDLPPQSWEVMTCEPTAEQSKLMQAVYEGKELLIGDLLMENTITAKYQALRQIAGGFMYKTKDGIRDSFFLSNNPKLELLDECLKIIHGKFIIFHGYTEEGRIIEAWCKKKKIKCACLRGETKNKEKQYLDFVNNPDIRVMVAHPDCASESYDMTVANTTIFYSNDDSVRARMQAEGRTWRKNAKDKCLYIDFLMDGSLDYTVMDSLRNGKDLHAEVLKHIKEKI